MFFNNILPNPHVHREYYIIYLEDTKYEHPVPGYIELDALIAKIGWKTFLIALEHFAYRRGEALISCGKNIGKAGVLGVVKKIKGIPKWLGK